MKCVEVFWVLRSRCREMFVQSSHLTPTTTTDLQTDLTAQTSGATSTVQPRLTAWLPEAHKNAIANKTERFISKERRPRWYCFWISWWIWSHDIKLQESLKHSELWLSHKRAATSLSVFMFILCCRICVEINSVVLCTPFPAGICVSVCAVLRFVLIILLLRLSEDIGVIWNMLK